MRKWTPEERLRQSLAIAKWKPWRKSTGPVTQHGKKVSSRNAIKHGLSSIEGKALIFTLSQQKRFLKEIARTRDIKG